MREQDYKLRETHPKNAHDVSDGGRKLEPRTTSHRSVKDDGTIVSSAALSSCCCWLRGESKKREGGRAGYLQRGMMEATMMEGAGVANVQRWELERAVEIHIWKFCGEGKRKERIVAKRAMKGNLRKKREMFLEKMEKRD